MDKPTCRQTKRQTDRLIDANRLADRQTYRQIDYGKEKDRQPDQQADRQTDRQTDHFLCLQSKITFQIIHESHLLNVFRLLFLCFTVRYVFMYLLLSLF